MDSYIPKDNSPEGNTDGSERLNLKDRALFLPRWFNPSSPVKEFFYLIQTFDIIKPIKSEDQ